MFPKLIRYIILAGWLALVSSSSSSAAYVRRWIGAALLQVMAYRLFGTKPLPEPIHCQLDPWEPNSLEFESKRFFHENAF